MREILFRGKSKDKRKWVLGNLVYGFDPKEEAYIEFFRKLEDDSDELHFERISVAVDPETVGQYTGKTDKNGKGVFEGDIVRQTFEGKQYTECWYEDYDGFDVGTVTFTGCGTFIKPSYGELNRSAESCDWKPHRKRLISYRAEVIGNIYDNPELLEAKEDG